MNKIHKDIAGIIKKYNCVGLSNQQGNSVKITELANDLADYFEREDKRTQYESPYGIKFNRKQFLKECGVE